MFAVGVGIFAGINFFRLPAHAVVPVVTFNCVVISVALALRRAVGRELILTKWANPGLAGLLGVTAANALFALWILSDLVQTNVVVILQIAAGCLMLSYRWLGVFTTTLLAAWILTAGAVASSRYEFVQFGATLLGAVLLSVIIHAVRLRAQQDLEAALRTAKKEVIERQQAEQRLQEAYDDMEQRVDRRTAALHRANGQLREEIAERQQAEKALRQSEALFRAISEQLPDGLLLVDWDNLEGPGRIIHANPVTLKMHGYASEELLGMPITQLTGMEGEGAVLERSERLRSGETLVFETHHYHRDGSTFPVEIVIRMIEYDGRSVSLGISRDISQRKRAEEEQRQLMIQVQTGQKLESLGILAGGIAHDFNNLLAGTLGNTGLALQKLSPESPARPFIRQIEKITQRAAALVDQMLAYSGQGSFTVESIHLGHLVREMVDLLKTSISKKAIFKLHLEKDVPAIKVDSTQVRQVVMNLITNASDALGDSSGTISVEVGVQHANQKFLKATYLNNDLATGSYVYLEVTDTGCGMDQETQTRLFDPFFTTKKSGRGLGMAAVLGIVRGHHGAIRLVSEPGYGSTFRILFPAAGERLAENRAKPSENTNLADVARSQNGRLILVVDDEEALRLVAAAVLERLGFEVKTAADGKEALEFFSQHDAEISAVLLDLTMPRLNGQETFLEMRRIRPDIKVILMSGFAEKDVAGRLPLKDLAGFLKKPFQVTDFAQKVTEVLK